MTNESESFFQEVDEKLREERMVTVAKTWGPWLIGGVVVILLGVLGWIEFGKMNERSVRDRAATFAEVQEQARSGDLAGALAGFENLTDEGPKIYRVMAMMEQAAVLQAQGDLQAALAGFDEAATAASDDLLRDSARLRAAYIVADTQDFPALQARLRPIIDDGGQLSYLARELLGVEAWEAGRTELARATLETLTLAFDAPESVRQRAELTMSLLGPAPEPAPAPASGEPSPGETK